MKIFLGEYPVIENKMGAITINIATEPGKNIFITIHVPWPVPLRTGDKLPLYTELPEAKAA